MKIQPVGLADSKDFSEKISRIIKTKIVPIPQAIMEIHEELGNEFVILIVSSGIETPYLLHRRRKQTFIIT